MRMRMKPRGAEVAAPAICKRNARKLLADQGIESLAVNGREVGLQQN